jgi:hypothetical protein
MEDSKIKELWSRASSLYHKGGLSRRIALLDIEELEAAGVTCADIDRLFPPTAAQLWLRQHVDACDVR